MAKVKKNMCARFNESHFKIRVYFERIIRDREQNIILVYTAEVDGLFLSEQLLK